jgi:UDP:flavonoid glycosyltransferase YjiC (YdhE family)
MRVGIQGWGSEGDLRPLVALAARLRKCGHESTLAFTPVDGTDYRPQCESLGVALSTVPERMGVTLQALVRDAGSANPTKVIAKVLALTFDPHVDAMYDAALELCESSDVVVAGPSCWPLKAASLKTQRRFAIVDYVPALVPSRMAPPVIFPRWRWLARPAWALLRTMMDMAFRAAPRKFFADKGLPPVRHTIPDVIFSDGLNLHAASPSFWPAESDWPETHCVCGELIMPDDVDAWTPSPRLRAFLDEGEAPVLFSLGSWEHMLPERARRFLVASAHAAGTRAIVQTKLSDVEEREGNVFVLPWAPHRKLVPLCSAVVHHGGAGTTHMALRAGKPALVLPFILEQRMWARRVERMRAGRWFSFWRATPQRVAHALDEILTSSALRNGAQRLAESMAHEDGAGLALRRLEAFAE